MTEPMASTPPPEERRLPAGAIFAGTLLVLAGLAWLLEALDVWEVPWGALLPVAIIAVGVALIVTARTGAHGGLITLGVILTLLAAAASVLDFPLRGGVGERRERPTSATQLDDDYGLGVGELTVDLSALDLPSGTTEVRARVGIGELTVTVPEDVAVEVVGGAGIGEVRVFDHTEGGVGAEQRYADEGYASAPARLSLDVSVGIGEVTVDR